MAARAIERGRRIMVMRLGRDAYREHNNPSRE